MNDNMYNNYEDDMEIDLVDLLFYLLKKWRSLIVAIVIGAILGAGLYVVKNHQQQAEQAAQEAELLKNEEDEAFDEKDYNISKDTKVNMDIAYQYRQLYNKQLEYNQKSIIMQLDPNAVYTGELKYYISAGNNTGLLSVLYQNVLNDDAVLEELKTASGFQCDTQYIKELIDSWTAEENAASVNINNGNETDSVNAVVKNSFVTYKVISTSQKSCEKMLQVIREKVDVLQSECEAVYGRYSAVEVSDNVSLVTDTTYLDLQRSNVDQLNNYLGAVKSAEGTFSDKEKTYYNKKYLAKEYAEKVNTEEEKDLILNVVETEPVSKVKWFAIGVIFLTMIWGVYYIIRYFFDQKIKTVFELQNTYHLPVIGCVKMRENNYKGLDKILDSIYLKMKTQPDTLEYVIQTINAIEIDEMMLCGDTKNPAIQELVKKMSEFCVCVKIGDFISKNMKSLERAKTTGNEILAVCVGATRRSELIRELEVCKLQKINVIGVIVVE